MWTRAKSRAITSLSSLTSIMMHACCAHCSFTLPVPLTVSQPDTSSRSQAGEPQWLCTEASLPRSAGGSVPPLHLFLFPAVCEMGDFKHGLLGRLQSAVGLSSPAASFALEDVHSFLSNWCLADISKPLPLRPLPA